MPAAVVREPDGASTASAMRTKGSSPHPEIVLLLFVRFLKQHNVTFWHKIDTYAAFEDRDHYYDA